MLLVSEPFSSVISIQVSQAQQQLKMTILPVTTDAAIPLVTLFPEKVGRDEME